MRLTQLARRAGFAVGGALALALVTAPAAVAQDTGTVYVVHGVPDTPVDVYVDGQARSTTSSRAPTRVPSSCRPARTRWRSSPPTPPTAPARRCSRRTRTCPRAARHAGGAPRRERQPEITPL